MTVGEPARRERKKKSLVCAFNMSVSAFSASSPQTDRKTHRAQINPPVLEVIWKLDYSLSYGSGSDTHQQSPSVC